MVNQLRKRVRLIAAVAALTVASVAVPAGSASAGESAQENGYLVVLKEHDRVAGLEAIERAGGEVVKLNKLGIATATSSNPGFASALGSSGAVESPRSRPRFPGRRWPPTAPPSTGSRST